MQIVSLIDSALQYCKISNPVKKKKKKSGGCIHESHICTDQLKPLIKNPWRCILIKGKSPSNKNNKSPQSDFDHQSCNSTATVQKKQTPGTRSRGVLLLMLGVSRHPRTPREAASLKVSPCSSECWMNHYSNVQDANTQHRWQYTATHIIKCCTFQDMR